MGPGALSNRTVCFGGRHTAAHIQRAGVLLLTTGVQCSAVQRQRSAVQSGIASDRRGLILFLEAIHGQCQSATHGEDSRNPAPRRGLQVREEAWKSKGAAHQQKKQTIKNHEPPSSDRNAPGASLAALVIYHQGQQRQFPLPLCPSATPGLPSAPTLPLCPPSAPRPSKDQGPKAPRTTVGDLSSAHQGAIPTQGRSLARHHKVGTYLTTTCTCTCTCTCTRTRTRPTLHDPVLDYFLYCTVTRTGTR